MLTPALAGIFPFNPCSACLSLEGAAHVLQRREERRREGRRREGEGEREKKRGEKKGREKKREEKTRRRDNEQPRSTHEVHGATLPWQHHASAASSSGLGGGVSSGGAGAASEAFELWELLLLADLRR